MGFLKYPGGKEKEIDVILKHAPKNFTRYFEPFVGGGAVFQNITANKYFINDLSTHLMYFYWSIKYNQTEFKQLVEKIEQDWKALDTLEDIDKIISSYKQYLTDANIETLASSVDSYLNLPIFDTIGIPNNIHTYSDEYGLLEVNPKVVIYTTVVDKIERLYNLEKKKHLPEEDIEKNIVGAFKAGYYTYIRTLYNHCADETQSFQAAVYYFIRETCYSCMFRFSKTGEFNVPYGGISYNSRSFTKKLKPYFEEEYQKKFNNTEIYNTDYASFLKSFELCDTDFIFLDPPYDSAFSTYDTNEFDRNAQIELADYLIKECKGKFMLVVKATDFINSLYKEGTVCANKNKLKVYAYDKNYFVSFMNRNEKDKKVVHLMICNY